MQGHVLGLVNHTHPAAAELLDDAVMRNGLTDHGFGQCYGGSVGQSMKVVELTLSRGLLTKYPHYTHNPLGVARNRHPAIVLSFGLTSKPSMIYVLVPQLGASPERVLVISEAGAGRKLLELFNVAPSQHNLFRLQCCAH